MSAREIHVIVVGVSVAGIKVAKTLATFGKTGGYPNLRITLVDRNAYHYHALGAPRSIVDKEFGKKLIFPLSTLLTPHEADPYSPKHRFIHAELTSVSATNVILSDGQSLPFDYLVLSTGARNRLPANLRSSTLADAQEEAARMHDTVARAESILVVGGGAVGVEMAGEIGHAYPDKSVTLVHSGPRLLPLNFKPAISEGAVAKLKKVGVTVYLNEKISIPADTPFDCTIRPLTLTGVSGREYTSDLQILVTGTQLHTEYMESLESALGTPLRDARGALLVNKYLQLDSPQFTNIFVPGDVNNLPAGAKFALKAAEQAASVAQNLIALIKAPEAGKPAVLKPWDGSLMNLILVPIGRNMGVFQGMGLTLGNSWWGDVMARNMKGKDYFLSQKEKDFPPRKP
ncbi:hypothetical protein IWW57_003061 [Coemansia sp. S610]|uniref:Uncharacterized protein n=1 Tax=Coemansia linderi TaxID=2663919 RepID=A0ACC1KPU5_9FUNG|nr:hypothetical protein IWW57_003061 [Coemansia sp. S610]KAJ2792807.1 hypothetical protein GGI18_000107 [Coemansia linderi]